MPGYVLVHVGPTQSCHILIWATLYVTVRSSGSVYQPDFSADFFSSLKNLRVHTCLHTISMHVLPSVWTQNLMPVVQNVAKL